MFVVNLVELRFLGENEESVFFVSTYRNDYLILLFVFDVPV